MLKLASVFAAIFLAELGDKTQLATLFFATDRQFTPMQVFLASASALVLSSALAVLAGATLGRYLPMIPIKLLAGIGFIAIGIWTIVDHLRLKA